MIAHVSRMAGVMCLVIGLIGCTTTREAGSGDVVSPELAKAESLFQKGDYTGAMLECVDLAQSNPDMPGLDALQRCIMAKLDEQRAARAAVRSAGVAKRMDNDVARHKEIPDTYGLRRAVKGQTEPLRTPGNAMQKALQKRVTVHLDAANLNTFILTIGEQEKVNIVADSVVSDKTMTIHAEQVPLAEILDYVSRNLGVAFYMGENIIWATPQEQGSTGIPMETRMYRLRKGLDGKLGAADEEALAEGSEEENLALVQAIQRFVAQPEGADLMFDKRSHCLIVRNTVENLSKVEDIIDTMDICPPQVLIEARFISTSVTDLRELGIDWVLNSSYVVLDSEGNPRTQINKSSTGKVGQDGSIAFTPSADNSQLGLNVSYEGLLTDPAFRAVIHALEKTGKARTLSVPKVTTVNNRPASIRVGEDFRYYDEYEVQSTPSQVSGTAGNTVYSSSLVPVGSPKLEELGIELKVRPSVGADMNSITLQLIPEISEWDRWEYYQVGSGNGGQSTSTTNGTSFVKLPIFRRSKIQTEVIVQSGETVVMGGLITSSEAKKKDKVPFLGSLPLIGLLFQNDVVDNAQKNLLIFVTATIISERGENLVPLVGPRAIEGAAVPAANAGK